MSLRYRMTLPVHDNSGVNTRQVRRQRERLAKKGRTDSGGTRFVFSASKYMPHQGKREKARRIRQLADIAGYLTRSTAGLWLARNAA